MIALERHLDEIRDTEKQIRATQSKQRKYELHRHLAKLQKEYRTAKRHMKEGGQCRKV